MGRSCNEAGHQGGGDRGDSTAVGSTFGVGGRCLGRRGVLARLRGQRDVVRNPHAERRRRSGGSRCRGGPQTRAGTGEDGRTNHRGPARSPGPAIDQHDRGNQLRHERLARWLLSYPARSHRGRGPKSCGVSHQHVRLLGDQGRGSPEPTTACHLLQPALARQQHLRPQGDLRPVCRPLRGCHARETGDRRR